MHNFLDFENFLFAWKKIKRALKKNDICVDIDDLAEFESDLENNIYKLINDIKTNNYIQQKIKIVPLPKQYNNEKKEKQVRQYFYIPIRTQLVWVAIVNVFAQIDYRIKFWNYGNRLYYPVFYEQQNNEKKLKLGWYRSTSGILYRKWQQSWPLFRKHILITIKYMFNTGKGQRKIEDDFDNDEKEIIKHNEQIQDRRKILYISKDYWLANNQNKPLSGDVFWVTIDFEKFYPSIKLDALKKCFIELIHGEENESFSNDFINQIFNFEIENTKEYENYLQDLNIQSSKFDSLPTGLEVAGFLSNIFLIHIDSEIEKYIKNKNIAIFRFVDDHVILSDEFDELNSFLNWYEKILSQYGLKINQEKINPIAFRQYYINKINKDEAQIGSKIDQNFPTPFLNETLKKISNIAQTHFELLNTDEQNQILADILHLFTIELDENELRKDTKLSFCALRLCDFLENRCVPINELYDLVQTIKNKTKKIKEAKKILDNNDDDNPISCIIEREIGNYDVQANDKKQLKEHIALLQKYFADKYFLKYFIKAIEDHHDKRALYYRTIEFCAYAGLDIYKDFFSIIIPKIEEKCFNIAIPAVLIICFNSLIKILIKHFYISIDSHYQLYNPIQYENSKKFINAINTENNIKELENISAKYNQEILTHSFCNLKDVIFIINNYNSNNNMINLTHEKAWLFHSQFDTGNTKIRDQVQKYIFQSLKNNITIKNTNYYSLMNPNHDCRKNQRPTRKKEYVDLLDFLKNPKVKDLKKENQLLDFFSKIVDQFIHEELQSENISLEDIDTYEKIPIHPKNILFNNKKIKLCLNSKYIKDYFIDDEFRKIFYMGIIFLMFVQDDSNVSLKIWDIVDNGRVSLLPNVLFKNIRKNISSRTLNIIFSCLSPRAKETTLIENFFKSFKYNRDNIDFNSDIDFDGKAFNNLKDLREEIEEAKEDLKKMMLPMPNGNTRQLILKKIVQSQKINALMNKGTNFDRNIDEFINISIIQSTCNLENLYKNREVSNINPLSVLQLEKELHDAFAKINDDALKPDFVLIPELSTPNSYNRSLKRYANNLNSVIIAGMNYRISDKTIKNFSNIYVPKKLGNKDINFKSKIHEMGKCYQATVEKKFCKKYKWDSDDNIYIYDAGFKGLFGIVICSDVFDIDRFSVYRGYIQNLFIIAYNKDTEFFVKIAETLSRTIYCNVIICNTGYYGDSLVYVPFKENYKRFVFRHSGQQLFTTQTIRLPLNNILKVQQKKRLKDFKLLPPAYKLKI